MLDDTTCALSSEGVIMKHVETKPGRLADLRLACAWQEMHEHGCAIRAYQVYGGRFTGCYGYNVSFTDMAAMGFGGIQVSKKMKNI